MTEPSTAEAYENLYEMPRSAPVSGRAPVMRPNLATICGSLPGKYKRLPTYIEPLDALLNGGFQTGRIIVLGGPPGVTKTGAALFIAYEQARRGVTVQGERQPITADYVASDEPRDGCLSRLGQMEGVDRRDLDSEDVSISGPAWALVAERIAAIPDLTVWDPREENVTVETIANAAADRADKQGGRAVVVIDSLQLATFSVDESMADKSLRERMDARMKALRAIAIKRRVCFVVLSELNRAGYGQGREADIASFKESSGVEYGVDVALLLARVKKEPGFVVECSIVKSRLGESDVRFRLERTDRCTFRPVAIPDEEEIEQAQAAKVESEIDRLAEDIVRALLGHRSPPTNRADLLRIAPGPNDLKGKAITALLLAGRIEGGKGKPFQVVQGST